MSSYRKCCAPAQNFHRICINYRWSELLQGINHALDDFIITHLYCIRFDIYLCCSMEKGHYVVCK